MGKDKAAYKGDKLTVDIARAMHHLKITGNLPPGFTANPRIMDNGPRGSRVPTFTEALLELQKLLHESPPRPTPTVVSNPSYRQAVMNLPMEQQSYLAQMHNVQPPQQVPQQPQLQQQQVPQQLQQQQMPISVPLQSSNSGIMGRGIVKQVLSGDTMIIRNQPKGGPPKERQLNLSNIVAPRLARRPGPNTKPEDTRDEPWAWEAREYLRNLLVGKEVLFVIDHTVPASGRQYGTLFLGKDMETGININEAIVAEGLATVRREGKADLGKLPEAEDAAKLAGKGKWGPDNEKHIREVFWTIDNPRAFLDKMGRKPIPAVVEHVRDGSTIRVFLLPSFHYITLMVSGIRSPVVKLDSEGKPDPNTTEAFADEAKFFTEVRLLQREVEVILESLNNNINFVGSVLHPNGNIAEHLLRDGFARCVDWSMGAVTGGAEKLRFAEKCAKERKLKIWRDYQGSSNNAMLALEGKDREFDGLVVECVNADAMVLKLGDGTLKRIFLSSLRPPRLPEDKSAAADGEKKAPAAPAEKKQFRALYDIPFMYEAREYLRKKLIGKKVHVVVDYIQAAVQTFPEKICCTVKADGINIGEALVSKGLATVVRHRQDDDQRSSEYDNLLAAEAKAQKAGKGLYGKKDQPTHQIVDITGDAAKAKLFLPYFQRAGKTTAVVEFVAAGSRLRLFVPREMRLITFLLGGITCPKASRMEKGGNIIPAEPFGEEAQMFTKELCLQREVEIEVDSIDKVGNFIGFLWIDNKNLSVALVEEGLSSVHFSAERTNYYRQLQLAEDNAKARREKIWLNYEDTKGEVKPEDDRTERKVDYKSVVVTEVNPDLHAYVQFIDDGDKLEAMTNDLRRELAENPPLTGAYTPRKGAICAAKFSADGEWYRARIEKELPNKQVQVLFIDYGNREIVQAAKCAALPSAMSLQANPFAREYVFACVTLPTDEEDAAEAIQALRQDSADARFLLNVEYKIGGLDYATFVNEATREDLGQTLVRDGLLLVDNRKERRLQKMMKEYKAAEYEAKKGHLNVWRYGDVTEDDAREFGMAR